MGTWDAYASRNNYLQKLLSRINEGPDDTELDKEIAEKSMKETEI